MTFNPKPLDLSLWDKRSQLTWLKNPACSNPVRNVPCYKNLTVSLMEGGPGAWVLTYTRILSCRRGSADADIYRRKAWQHSTTAWWNGFCSCRVFLLKSSPGVFLWPVPPPPNSPTLLLLSLHIWEPLAGRTWGYCTPPHIMREAWQGEARSVIQHHTGVSVQKRKWISARK